MGIIITDNFHVNAEKPIDNRFVVGASQSFYANRDQIQNKYVGLRIWDLVNNGPFYWTGTSWENENVTGVTSDVTATINFLSKFTSSNTTIGKSLLFEQNGSIGLGLTVMPPGTLLNSFLVKGDIKSIDGGFVGNGVEITNINATNVTSGAMNPTRIAGGGPGFLVLYSDAGVVSWKLANTLSVNLSTNSDNAKIIDDITSNSTNFITFVSNVSGYNQLRVSSTKLQYKPDTGQLLLENGSLTNPVYSFKNNPTTGIYTQTTLAVNSLSIGVSNNEIGRFNENGIYLLKGSLYVPTSTNDNNIGLGIIWSTGGNYLIDTFLYNTQRLNYYGIGSHVPTESDIPTGRGSYIGGYFGVDIFTGGNNIPKIKVHQDNNTTINTVLNISQNTQLGSATASVPSSQTNSNNVTLMTMKNFSQNNIVIKDLAVRGIATSQTSDWLTWKHHNGITIDGTYDTPNGPSLGALSPLLGTLTYWERYPYKREQYFGSGDKRTLTINSDTTPYIKIDGTLLVGTSNVVNSSVLADFNSTTRGILPPKMTTTQRNLILGVQGLVVYNTTKNKLETNDGINWHSLVGVRNIGWFSGLGVGGSAGINYPVSGDFTSAISIGGMVAENSLIEITMANPMPNMNYKVNISVESEGNIEHDNDCTQFVFKKVSFSKFRIAAADISGNVQSLKVHLEVVQL